jgi:hypothetical protein
MLSGLLLGVTVGVIYGKLMAHLEYDEAKFEAIEQYHRARGMGVAIVCGVLLGLIVGFLAFHIRRNGSEARPGGQ